MPLFSCKNINTTYNCICRYNLVFFFCFLIKPIRFFLSTSLYVTHGSICFSIIWWGIQRILFLHTRVTEMFPQISLSITNPKKMFIMFANKGKGFSILSHIYAYLHLGLECEKKKKITYISQFFFSHSYSQIKIHRNHICLPAAIR